MNETRKTEYYAFQNKTKNIPRTRNFMGQEIQRDTNTAYNWEGVSISRVQLN